MHLQELTLSAVNLEEARQFYCAILGFREIEPHWTERLGVQAGGTRLLFLPAPLGWTGRYHFAFSVPGNRFEESLRWLRERRGFLIGSEGQNRFHHDSLGADVVYFNDPQGNILELVAHREVRAPKTELERPFSANDILGVCEIGLAAGSVVDSVASLTTHMPGLKVFSQEISEDFTAVGDLNGRFVVVRRGRIWFPNTGVPAIDLPLEALVEVEEGQDLKRRYRLTAPPYPFTIQPAN